MMQQYLPVFYVVLIVLVVGLILFFPTRRKSSRAEAGRKNEIANYDISAIAGDDVMVTQLDLARAYIEMGKIQLAQQLLQNVIRDGDVKYQEEARQLLQSL